MDSSGSTTGNNGDHEIRRCHQVRQCVALLGTQGNARDSQHATMVLGLRWDKEKGEEQVPPVDRDMDKGRVVEELADNKDRDNLKVAA